MGGGGLWMQRLNVSGDKDGVVVVMETSHRGNSPFTRQKGTWCVNMKGKGVKTTHRHLLYFTLRINALTAVKLQLFFAVVAFNLETGSCTLRLRGCKFVVFFFFSPTLPIL